MAEIFDDRKRALEEEFFRKQEEKLLERLRAERRQQEGRAELQRATGIADPALLDKLLALRIDAASLAAFSLVPLVEVAWADAELDDKERQAVLQAAEGSGVAPASAERALLESWLASRPPERLFRAWEEYTASLAGALDPAQRARLKEEVVGRARRVAEAAGGFLGMAKVSEPERKVLERLEKAFG